MACLPTFAVTNQFRGVNWADKRDNFVSEVLVLSDYRWILIICFDVADRVIGRLWNLELLALTSY